MIELTLPSMTCGHCVRVVTQAVKTVDERADVQVDLDAHRVRIDSDLPVERFRTALADEGYEPA